MFELRELRREDLKIINLWRHSRDLIDLLGATYRFINDEVEVKWYENYLNNRDTTIRASVIDNTGELLGLVSLTNIDRFNQSAFFHIMIGDESKRGLGIGTFAITEILSHAFLDMNLNRVELSVLESNAPALALYKKMGFKSEGIKRQAVFKNGEFVNLIRMSILKNEFQNKEQIK